LKFFQLSREFGYAVWGEAQRHLVILVWMMAARPCIRAGVDVAQVVKGRCDPVQAHWQAFGKGRGMSPVLVWLGRGRPLAAPSFGEVYGWPAAPSEMGMRVSINRIYQEMHGRK